MAEVDLRLLRYFVAVAEERSFTRAADRLAMTQGALSRAIRTLEAVVGAPLLMRPAAGRRPDRRSPGAAGAGARGDRGRGAHP